MLSAVKMSMSNPIHEIIEEFHVKREQIEIPLVDVKKELSTYDNIVLYGAGSAGIAFLHYLLDAGIKPAFFSDGDKAKHGNVVEGLSVLPPAEIVTVAGKNCLVVVTINTDGEHYCKDFKKELRRGGHKGVHRALHQAGCLNVIDYTYFRRCYALFTNEKYNLPACSDIEMILDNTDKVSQALEVLSDDESKDTFCKILRFRLISDEVDIPVYPESKMYFEYDLFPKTDEVFVDCGACGGSSLDTFLTANNDRFAKYYGIEPDITNYNNLASKIQAFPAEMQKKMHICNSAAWDSTSNVSFFVLHGPGSFQADIGPDIVNGIKIDDVLAGNSATYIKMNIEGSETKALRGAYNTIIKYKPRLAIMGYHKTSDFWEVPLIIKEYRSDYDISLRSYMKNVAFTYYAY